MVTEVQRTAARPDARATGLASRALVSDADGIVGSLLAERLEGSGWEVRRLAAGARAADGATSWPEGPAGLRVQMKNVDLLFLPDLAGVDMTGNAAGAAAVLEGLEHAVAAAASAGVPRVILLGSAEAYGAAALARGGVDEAAPCPGPDLSPNSAAARSAALEAKLLRAFGSGALVLRSLEVVAAGAPVLLAQVRAVMAGDPGAWRRDRLHGIAATDLADAMVQAARNPGAGGACFNLAAPAVVGRDAAVAEIYRLAEVLADQERSEVQVRSSYPPVPPVLETALAARDLHFKPRTSLWSGLAQLVQAVTWERRAEGLLPPIAPQMPAVLLGVERREAPLRGKTAVVTGATAGIGHAAALLLARLGAQVVAVGRNRDAGAALVDGIAQMPDAAPALYVAADLSEMRDVRALASRLCGQFPTIDILLNNAGAVFPERGETAEGHERTLALNLLAPLLLTRLLAGPLTEAQARVVNVTSEAHRNSPVEIGDLQSRFDYHAMSAYGRAKSGLIMMTLALAEVAGRSGVRFHAINPGAVRTDIWSQVTGHTIDTTGMGPQAAQRVESLRERIRQRLLSPEQAAVHLVNLAMAPEFAGDQGLYMDMDKVSAPADHVLDRETAIRLWRRCAELTGTDP